MNNNQYCKHEFIKEVMYGQKTGDWVCKHCKEIELKSDELIEYAKKITKQNILQNQKLIEVTGTEWKNWENWINHDGITVEQIVKHVYETFGFLP